MNPGGTVGNFGFCNDALFYGAWFQGELLMGSVRNSCGQLISSFIDVISCWNFRDIDFVKCGWIDICFVRVSPNRKYIPLTIILKRNLKMNI